MQSNIFAKAAPLLRDLKFECYSSRLESFLEYYHSGDWICPATLHRETGLKIKEVYTLLERCVSIGIVAQALEIYCPHCQRFIGKKSIIPYLIFLKPLIVFIVTKKLSILWNTPSLYIRCFNYT